MSESSGTAFGVGQFGYFHYFGCLMFGDDHLAYTLAGFDGLWLAAEIDEYHAHLAAVVGIDGTRGIEDSEAAFECQTAARTNLRLVACRQFDEEARRYESTLKGLQRKGFADVAADVHSCGLLALIARQGIIALVDDF